MVDLKRFSVILLDMNGTFMFGQDRFGEEQDFAATYRRFRGSLLGDADVSTAIRACLNTLEQDYTNPAKYDDFPSVRSVLKSVAPSLPAGELAILEAVIEWHELGHIPPNHALVVRQLASSHDLGLVSNIWSAKTKWIEELERCGLQTAFGVTVFSSDHGSIKPSPTLFNIAIESFDSDRSKILFVGDSVRCDINGARSVGLKTALISNGHCVRHDADYVLSSLLDLTQ